MNNSHLKVELSCAYFVDCTHLCLKPTFLGWQWCGRQQSLSVVGKSALIFTSNSPLFADFQQKRKSKNNQQQKCHIQVDIYIQLPFLSWRWCKKCKKRVKKVVLIFTSNSPPPLPPGAPPPIQIDDDGGDRRMVIIKCDGDGDDGDGWQLWLHPKMRTLSPEF